MDFGGFVTWVIIGALVGWLAGIVMKDGGYGRPWDLVLGLAGSSAASVAGWILSAAPGFGGPATAFFALVGAGIVIVGQRKVWPAPAVAPRRVRVAPRA